MKKHCWLLIFLVLFSSLMAQEITVTDPDADTPLSSIFPIGLLLDAAEYTGKGIWQPDWPSDFPPDAFWITDDKMTQVTVFNQDISLSLSWINGYISSFPWFYNGSFYQVYFDYVFLENDDKPLINSITLSYPNAAFISALTIIEIAQIQVLDYFDGAPYLLRIYTEGQYFFVYLQWGTGLVLESWFDSEGNFLEQFEYNFLNIQEYNIISRKTIFSNSEIVSRSFDSRFLITDINTSQEFFSVTYFQDYLPRYWRRGNHVTGEEVFSFQWDNNKLLLRLAGYLRNPDNMQDTILNSDSIYEYLFDERGNWTERREAIMTGGTGLMLQGPGTTYTRLIEYGE